MLDLSLQWRFANLPNNAKLEMVPISRSREGPENMVGGSRGGGAPPSSSIQTTWAEQMEWGAWAVHTRHSSPSLGETGFSRSGDSHFSIPKTDDWK